MSAKINREWKYTLKGVYNNYNNYNIYDRVFCENIQQFLVGNNFTGKLNDRCLTVF